MKNILGFKDNEETKEVIPEETVPQPEKSEIPVRSVVKVWFDERHCAYDYYNDLFDLEKGDRVFVEGKLEGIPGVVVSVNTRFRIKLSDYKKIISKADMTITGRFVKVRDKMVSFDEKSLPPERFRLWVKPPINEEDEIICGEGYEVSLSDFEKEGEPAVLQRAINICNSGKVLYINITDGVGTAFVEGTMVYEINFFLEGDTVSQLYCECPYQGFCKHICAVLANLRSILEDEKMNGRENFTALDTGYFWSILSSNKEEIEL